MGATVRTQEEILARLNDGEDDFLGFRREVLATHLTFENVKPMLKPDSQLTEEEWLAEEGPDKEVDAEGYLEFAIGKIQNHRGISAGRSVIKLTEMAWLLGRDDVVAAMEQAEYQNYGAPQVKAFALGMGLPWPSNDQSLEAMANGEPCEPDCTEGCGQ
jgi:hypothetical protein